MVTLQGYFQDSPRHLPVPYPINVEHHHVHPSSRSMQSPILRPVSELLAVGLTMRSWNKAGWRACSLLCDRPGASYKTLMRGTRLLSFEPGFPFLFVHAVVGDSHTSLLRLASNICQISASLSSQKTRAKNKQTRFCSKTSVSSKQETKGRNSLRCILRPKHREMSGIDCS